MREGTFTSHYLKIKPLYTNIDQFSTTFKLIIILYLLFNNNPISSLTLPNIESWVRWKEVEVSIIDVLFLNNGNVSLFVDQATFYEMAYGVETEFVFALSVGLYSKDIDPLTICLQVELCHISSHLQIYVFISNCVVFKMTNVLYLQTNCTDPTIIPDSWANDDQLMHNLRLQTSNFRKFVLTNSDFLASSHRLLIRETPPNYWGSGSNRGVSFEVYRSGVLLAKDFSVDYGTQIFNVTMVVKQESGDTCAIPKITWGVSGLMNTNSTILFLIGQSQFLSGFYVGVANPNDNITDQVWNTTVTLSHYLKAPMEGVQLLDNRNIF